MARGTLENGRCASDPSAAELSKASIAPVISPVAVRICHGDTSVSEKSDNDGANPPASAMMTRTNNSARPATSATSVIRVEM
jgi:hypothetical protein